MRFFLFLIFLFLCAIISPLKDVHAAQPIDDSDRLRANVLALDRVQNNIRKTIRLRKSAKNISRREEDELLIFADYLRERNREYCGQLEKQAGSAAVADLPCPPQIINLPRENARTTGEDLKDLDKQLDASLGEFDEMLLKEQERIAAHQPRQRESGGQASAGGSGGYGGQQGEQGNGSAAEASGGRTAGKQQEQGQASAAADQGKDGRVASTGATSSGSQGHPQSGSVNGPGGDKLHADDDIVARQLREAAEKETDPELKEKLWQEYRKYKAGL